MSLILAFSAYLHGQETVKGSEASIQSPDRKLTVKFYQKAIGPGRRAMYYQVHYDNKQVIAESELDLQLDNHLSERAMALKVDKHEKWFENLSITNISTSSKDSSWSPVVGERAVIRDRYNALTVQAIKDDNPIYPVNVEIRAYDQGAAIRYFFPENEKGTYYRIVSENTEFSLPEGTRAWHASWAQAPYRLLPLKDWPDESERPLTLELPNGLYACLAEAQMVDYARTKFKLSTSRPNTILTSMYTPADLVSPFGTPWRVIMVAEKYGDLIQNNDIILNLNPPSKIADQTWIRPGKIMRVMSQTTADAKANIDFAVRHKLQYVLFDWKWYGPAFSFSSDASKVAIPNFDLPGIIQYGKERGVGVWLYVNQQALLAQSDSLFKIYRKWDVKGVKFGFVQVGSHRWTTWVEKAIQQAAEAKIMVNIHDDWRPTGEQRTWPNLMTSEGIRGNEEMPDATHNTVLPFTRYIAGAADYTICYYDKRIKTTHAHQLAMAAVYYSPLQTLYWYDKPELSENEPELEFWDKIPTTWDETKILQGTPGQFITVARRKGQDWFIGTLNNTEARSLRVDLAFLPRGAKYQASIYNDDPDGGTKNKVGIQRIKVNSKTVIDSRMLASGGQAIWLKLLK
ncbi:glycoside hydrolase family 97 protein [Desertivirga arenae]|uniref:glycoside hydrolase family 97 protein n=1 Tax=Desertivirga arenae TaxID=2810309 RepID=UPI001A970E6F|nr:glycoside hydrolase family 97 protein [Pedobacter sp. SYSU D00823]